MTDKPLLFASDRTAAKMLDMTHRKFTQLVKEGALPPPVDLDDDTQRWRVTDLEAIASGEAAGGEFVWS